jgi:2-keto-4-pentenoate hydratase/2-oxohepta-3-ene-1,7-dioic acid hydratase in catechol pathway
VIGAEGAVGGYSLYAEWREPARTVPKDRDFCVALGPVVATPDELDASAVGLVVRVDGDERLRGALGGFDWARAVELAGDGTKLRPGDVIVSPPVGEIEGLERWTTVELDVAGIGVLATSVSG